MKRLLFFGALLLCNSAFAQHKGQVYLDGNGNKKIDSQEVGLPGVVVSDGYEVVQTDAKGQFSIPTNPDARFLFVTVPSGYKSSTTHYLKIDHKQEVFDFGMVKDESQRPDFLRFIQVTDTETPLYGSWIDNIRNYAQHQEASLIMHTGDICYEPGMQFHARQVNSDLMGRSTYYTVGNHDLVKGEYGEKLFEDLFGPVYYSFNAGPVHFVVTPMPSGDYAPRYTQDQVISWLKKDLALKEKDKPLIFINHDLIVGKDFIMKGKTQSIDLRQYNLKAYLYGHWHNNYVFGQSSDVLVISTNAPNKGGIDHSVGQFMVIDVDKNGVRQVAPKYPNLNDHIELIYPKNSDICLIENKKLNISANIYDSEREVASVKAILFDGKGKWTEVCEMSQASDWNWRGTAAVSSDVKRDFELILEVNYKDGHQALKKSQFKAQASPEANLRLSWSTNIGANIWKVSPLVQGNRVFVATIDDSGSEKGKIAALAKADGQVLWEFKTKNSVKQKLRYSDGVVLATDVGGVVYALNETDGKLIWSKALSGGKLPAYVTAGVVRDGYYYTGAGNYLSALRVVDGELLWQNKDWNGGEGMPGEMLATADHLITGANWNALFVHDRKTGQLRWKKNDDGVRFRSSGASADDNGLYVAGLNGLFLLNEKSGQVIRKRIYEDDFKVMAAPLLSGNQLIMPSSLGGVKSYDKNTFEERWVFETGEALIYTSSYTTPDLHKLVGTVESGVVQQGQKLFFGASDGYLYVLNLEGKLLDKVNVGAPILAETALDDRHVYIADFAGNVYCFSVKD
ncbi:outer membrane protein assembly factor BamB family protein [Sphingobacterium sp. SYP-B4668]|uniref:outer membrane protein assembly factor BamB family protein n=1 Tax=Sphingobacterium sp. SYP-B4668 TaxID=2996035 RepID=UPI0022DD52DF|nr:PQQ-binding-like beta-propeller repeat protein [Sphingobacterium sp. SYP-B4668]